MNQCHQCEGFIPSDSSQCPNCNRKHKRSFKHLFKRFSQMVMGTGFMVTLSACYGSPDMFLLPPCEEGPNASKQNCMPKEEVCDESKDTDASCVATPSPSPSGSPSPSPSAVESADN